MFIFFIRPLGKKMSQPQKRKHRTVERSGEDERERSEDREERDQSWSVSRNEEKG